jgi:hypothetical protein
MSITETKLRYLINELAKDVLEIDTILQHINVTHDEYSRLSGTRAFKEALVVAQIEWQGATNTTKRTKLKAAAIVEELIMVIFFEAKNNKEESLNAKVKALDTIARIAGIGALEPAAGAPGSALGNTFNLQINYSNNTPSELITLGAPLIDGELMPISAVFAGDELEEL